MTIFQESKGWDSESAIFNRWCLLPTLAFKRDFLTASLDRLHLQSVTLQEKEPRIWKAIFFTRTGIETSS